MILNIFSLDYLLPTYTSFTYTLPTPLIFPAEILANVEQHRSGEQQHNHLPDPHRHRGPLHGSGRPEHNSATSSTCSNPSGGVQHTFCHVFARNLIQAIILQLSTTSTLRADDSVQVGKHHWQTSMYQPFCPEVILTYSQIARGASHSP